MEGIQNSDVATLALLANGTGWANNRGNSDAATLALLANNRDNHHGDCHANHGNFSYDGSVLAAKSDRNFSVSEAETTRIVDNQKSNLDTLAAIAENAAAVAREARSIDRFASLDRLLFNQFNQIDRRFSDASLKLQECCCELQKGQATIIAKIDAQDLVANAVANAMQTAKLDQLLSNNGPGNS